MKVLTLWVVVAIGALAPGSGMAERTLQCTESGAGPTRAMHVTGHVGEVEVDVTVNKADRSGSLQYTVNKKWRRRARNRLRGFGSWSSSTRSVTNTDSAHERPPFDQNKDRRGKEWNKIKDSDVTSQLAREAPLANDKPETLETDAVATLDELVDDDGVSEELVAEADAQMHEYDTPTTDCDHLMRRISEYLSLAPLNHKFPPKQRWGARVPFDGLDPASIDPASGSDRSIPHRTASTDEVEQERVVDQAFVRRRAHRKRSARKGSAERRSDRHLLGFGDDGAGSALDNDCLCPGWWRTAYYTDASGQGWAWNQQVGANSCTGRCGAGCSWWDRDYMVDCFEHDVCLDHFGGSVLGNNKHCGDEFAHAADDWIVTWGSWCSCP